MLQRAIFKWYATQIKLPDILFYVLERPTNLIENRSTDWYFCFYAALQRIYLPVLIVTIDWFLNYTKAISKYHPINS